MRGKLNKWLCIPWVLFLFVIAAILTLSELVLWRKHPIVSL